ncbi:TPA: HEPN domain-containing protein [Enterococcus faecium]
MVTAVNSLYHNYSNLNKKQLYLSLDSLRNFRNQIAHGDRINTSHKTVNDYIDNSILLLLLIKEILEAEYI